MNEATVLRLILYLPPFLIINNTANSDDVKKNTIKPQNLGILIQILVNLNLKEGRRLTDNKRQRGWEGGCGVRQYGCPGLLQTVLSTGGCLNRLATLQQDVEYSTEQQVCNYAGREGSLESGYYKRGNKEGEEINKRKPEGSCVFCFVHVQSCSALFN